MIYHPSTVPNTNHLLQSPGLSSTPPWALTVSHDINHILVSNESEENLTKHKIVYFNRSDVQEAIHAPSMEWEECSNVNVFPDGDSSLPSALTVLPGVIERTQNVIVSHGLLDMVLIANGTILQIQNTTWGGLQGFQTAPSDNLVVPSHTDYSDSTLAASGIMGTTHTERGLTYATVELSGHMIPQYQPSVAFRQIEVLLGRIDSLSSSDPFTVQVGKGAF